MALLKEREDIFAACAINIPLLVECISGTEVDFLYLNAIAFPVRRGVLSRGRKELGDYCWELEIYCDESPQLDDHNSPDDRPETEDDLLAGVPPLLSAQALPLRIESPDELIGREYLFPPTPLPNPPDWDTALGWPFFFLYFWEGSATEQLQVAFTGKRNGQYRVEIEADIKTAASRMRCGCRRGWSGRAQPTTQTHRLTQSGI